MSQNLLHRLDVHTAGEHQGGGGVAQFVRRKLACIQAGGQQMFFDQAVHGADANPIFIPRTKQGAVVG